MVNEIILSAHFYLMNLQFVEKQNRRKFPKMVHVCPRCSVMDLTFKALFPSLCLGCASLWRSCPTKSCEVCFSPSCHRVTVWSVFRKNFSFQNCVGWKTSLLSSSSWLINVTVSSLLVSLSPRFWILEPTILLFHLPKNIFGRVQ